MTIKTKILSNLKRNGRLVYFDLENENLKYIFLTGKVKNYE